jgi:hypothetical protein
VSRWTALSLTSLAVGLVATTLAGDTMGSFTGTTSNSGNAFQAAASFCTNPGVETVDADADSWVDELLPVINHGTETSLFIQSELLQDRRALVSFMLPPVPPRCSVTLATLRLFAKSAAGSRTLEAYRADGSWTETGVNWNNQPASIGSPATTASGAGWREWIVTTQVQGMYSGSNHGFVLRDAVEDGALPSTQDLSSREDASNRPQLVITFG